MRHLLSLDSPPATHWVGDGFPVRSLFSYRSRAMEMSPFLLLDYAGPWDFAPAARPRGVGAHPHRGFETVTIVYQGEVEHRDSTGASGVIGPGDVQWMTAGAGILHEEFHSQAFTARGGTLEMVQLWVNLPAREKQVAPGYQALRKEDIPVVALPDGAGAVRVIAGSYGGRAGPARTFTPIDLWDVNVSSGHDASFSLPEGHTLAAVVLHGAVGLAGGESAGEGQLAVFARTGGEISLHAQSGCQLLLLSGAPIEEPVVGYGPVHPRAFGEH